MYLEHIMMLLTYNKSFDQIDVNNEVFYYNLKHVYNVYNIVVFNKLLYRLLQRK